MTLPNERTRSILAVGKFLERLSSPYGDGIKGVKAEVRQEARSLLRHYPSWFDLSRPGSIDPVEARRWAEQEDSR